jgi:hypothetical protein
MTLFHLDYTEIAVTTNKTQIEVVFLAQRIINNKINGKKHKFEM